MKKKIGDGLNLLNKMGKYCEIEQLISLVQGGFIAQFALTGLCNGNRDTLELLVTTCKTGR
jgi:hypothetical protein